MIERQSCSLSQARRLVRELRTPQREALPPPKLRSYVLFRVGLADGYLRFSSPIGPVFVALNTCGISALERAEDASSFEARFRATFGRAIFPLEHDEAPAWTRQIEAALQTGQAPNLPFDLRSCSPFEQAVLYKALMIPRGEVRPYAWVAREIGQPRAVRAVGNALARNPIPLLIPCHRVVRSDYRLGNYSLGGSFNKRALLQAEGVDLALLEQLASRGVRYLGSTTTHVYCFPTCPYARRIAPEHRRPLSSPAEATRLGYRPCQHCRPAPPSGQGPDFAR
ncbi:methylated-DNA--[protein]-cysteine S-methyltransferase [Thermogemmatispora sp.]|uniref:methylated-DNA--[protein]-cysteine S-methyltransferase n=1 Tax=Thermogemmatispora sp. TaxID=1968838 RepID=UPI001D50D642|nr:methylated-DNA--[protein]-cysteine S-methyltransferase [Thermogemmatispora sp.]MBX5451971.1 methylated-DNA--[protein]-cysteine S-methyltransferase [Thermogemmatispora sp.]